jgi:hypothetical protein
VSRDPGPQSPAQTLRAALCAYLSHVRNCREWNPCWDECSELVTDATDEWMAAIQHRHVSGPHLPSEE